MAFIVFVEGHNKQGKPVVVGLGLASNAEEFRASLDLASPFELAVVGREPGGPEKLRELQDRFASQLIRGVWYRPEAILEYAKALPAIDPPNETKRVSLDLEPEDFVALEVFVQETNSKTKSSLLRRAFRFYRALYRYRAQGYLIQAVKNGKLVQFPDLDDIRESK